GFEAVTVLTDDILLVPLVGHTRGHSGVAVRGPDGWILHAGDAYFHEGDVSPTVRTPPGLVAFQVAQSMVDRLRRDNLARLRELHARRTDITLFCAHDRTEYDRLAATSGFSG
ncbi:MAG: MBL fold metallo-hydrolase, partial [Cellulomonas sp.]